MNREEWLLTAIEKLRPVFECNGFTVPVVKVSTGFGLGRGTNSLKIAGQFWAPKSSADNVGTVFISPLSSDSLEVLGTLVHELVHAVVGVQHGHGPEFKRCALKVGLEGKMKSTTTGDYLKSRLNGIVSDIGAYPHAKLTPALSGRKKQSTRLVKQVCNECEYIVRSSQSAIDTHGPVICSGCNEPMKVGNPGIQSGDVAFGSNSI